MDKTEFDAIKKYFEETYKNVFPRNSDQIERHFRDTIELEMSENLFQRVCQSARLPAVPRILDVGCGFGTFVLVCRKKGYEAYGVDIAEYEINFARKRIVAEIAGLAGDEVYRLSSAESLPFENESFDVVTLWNLIEHVPDYKAVLREADRVLKPRGHLFLTAPNYLSLREEAHYHLLWFPLLPQKIGQVYLKLRGRDPSFLRNNVFYVTNLGVLGYLHREKYELVNPEFEKVENPDLCASKVLARALGVAKLLRAGSVIRFLIYLVYVNPFKRSISLCARKAL